MSNANSLYKKDEEIVIKAKINNDQVDGELTVETPIVESLSPVTVVNNDELYDSIKKIFNEGENIKKESVYFNAFKGVHKFDLDGTIFQPSSIVLLQPRRFEELYLKQLESFVYSNKEEVDTSKLFPIIYLFSMINKNNYPIRIVTGNYSKLLPKVCNILNSFFNKNYSVIYSIYTMFNTIKDTEEEGIKNE